MSDTNLVFHHAGLSDVGRLREANEDNWAADAAEGFYIVADGMGGHMGGAVAAKIAVDGLPLLLGPALTGVTDVSAADVSHVVRDAIILLSRTMRDRVIGHPDLEGMGATLVLVVIRGRKALVAHVGDSRVYLLRDGRLKQLTHDHSVVQMLIDLGEITQQDAEVHPARSVVTRSLGMTGDAVADISVTELEIGDRLLLCSDGLTGMVSDEQIAAAMANVPPADACQSLIAAANAAGGLDNITTVIVEAQPAA